MILPERVTICGLSGCEDDGFCCGALSADSFTCEVVSLVDFSGVVRSTSTFRVLNLMVDFVDEYVFVSVGIFFPSGCSIIYDNGAECFWFTVAGLHLWLWRKMAFSPFTDHEVLDLRDDLIWRFATFSWFSCSIWDHQRYCSQTEVMMQRLVIQVFGDGLRTSVTMTFR